MQKTASAASSTLPPSPLLSLRLPSSAGLASQHCAPQSLASPRVVAVAVASNSPG